MDDQMSQLSVLVALILGGILLLWVHHCSSGWRSATKSGARLPKGSFGWPIIGESLDFGKNPVMYTASHVKRYGKIFKSSLLMQPTIVGTNADFSKFVLSNPKLFLSNFPPTIERVLGPNAFVVKDGPSHMFVKKLVIKAVMPETLRTKVDVLEDIILQHLASWEQQGTVVGIDSTEKITLDIVMSLILGGRHAGKSAAGKIILENFKILNNAIFSPPINLPGTTYNKGFEAKARLSRCVKSLLEERNRTENIKTDDVLGVMLAARDDEEAMKEVQSLDDDLIVENVALMMFGAYDTTSTTLVWVLKLMNDYPDVFRRLQAEQRGIIESKGPSVGGRRLMWEDMRKMEYGQKFIKELQRFIPISPFVPRKAAEDVEYEGYLIPKGWAVFAMNSFIHKNPELYPDPSSFNPDRFNVTPKPYTYYPFGSGTHMCPGQELAKLVSLTMIHHLTTTFTHESAAPDKGIQYYGFPRPVGGYPINVRRN